MASIQLIFNMLLTWGISTGDNPYPKDYFRSPVDFPMVLSGTFGEPRNNHFHAGLDIKTYNQTGLKVYAVADGYVARIKISPYGYGKAIYVKHPNGFTSVYAHLKGFATPIKDFIRRQQYATENYAIERYPEPGQFPVKKGEVIAYTGNSGSSQAPHLHFELRASGSETPLNPLLFGFKVRDDIPPNIYSLLVYPKGNLRYKAIKYKVSKPNGKYRIAPDTIIVGTPEVAFSLATYDMLSGAKNRNGIYSLNASMDGEVLYSLQMNQIRFEQQRYLNCHIDYAEKIASKNTYHKCFQDKGNKLDIYDHNGGIMQLQAVHHVKLSAKDFAGNESSLSFYVKYDKQKKQELIIQESTRNFAPGIQTGFIQEDIRLGFQENSLYDTLYFEYQKVDTGAPIYSAIHRVHNESVPLHSAMKINIKAVNMPEKMKNKAVLIRRDRHNGIHAFKSSWSGNWLGGSSKKMGDFFIMADTTAPKIRPYNIKEGKDMKHSKSIKIKISDDLSGIKSYRATIDGKWILMEYDPKRLMLTYYFENNLSSGTHSLDLVVYDVVNNISKMNLNFTN